MAEDTTVSGGGTVTSDTTSAATSATTSAATSAATSSGSTQSATTSATTSAASATSATSASSSTTSATETEQPVDYGKAIAAVQLPEGMKIEDAQVASVSEIFTKHKIPEAAVADLVQLAAKQIKAGADGNASAFAKQVEGWKATSIKEVSKEDLALAKVTAPKVFDADTMKVVELFGLMDHPGVLKGLVKVGKAIKDDTFLAGDAGRSNGSADARKQFPNSNMNP